MPPDKKPVTVTVDSDVAKRADEALAAEIEAEVQAGINKEKTRMDATVTAALEAHKARADAAETQLKQLQAKADAAVADAAKANAAIQARADAERVVLEAETTRRARLIANAKGLRGDAAEAYAKNLAGRGLETVNLVAAEIPAPRADEMLLAMAGAGPDAAPVKDATIVRGQDSIDGKPTWTVTQAGWERALGRKLTRHQGGRPQ